MGLRVLITGAGFLGSHLVRDCVARGQRVTVLARPETRIWRLRDVIDRIDLMRVQPFDPRAMTEAVAEIRPDRVFHLIATTRISERITLADIDHSLVCNVEPLRHLIDAIRRLDYPVQALVRTGSIAEFGQSAEIHSDLTAERPENAYGLSALTATHMLRLARHRLNIPAVSARLSLTYGGDQSSDFLVPDMIRKGLAGTSPRLRRPQARRDLLHVDDTVAALQLIAENAADMPDIVNVSTGQPVAMATAAGLIAALLDRRPPTGKPIATQPDEALTLSCHPTPDLIDLGWRPRVALSDGLQQVIDWERDALKINPRECSL